MIELDEVPLDAQPSLCEKDNKVYERDDMPAKQRSLIYTMTGPITESLL